MINAKKLYLPMALSLSLAGLFAACGGQSNTTAVAPDPGQEVVASSRLDFLQPTSLVVSGVQSGLGLPYNLVELFSGPFAGTYAVPDFDGGRLFSVPFAGGTPQVISDTLSNQPSGVAQLTAGDFAGFYAVTSPFGTIDLIPPMGGAPTETITVSGGQRLYGVIEDPPGQLVVTEFGGQAGANTGRLLRFSNLNSGDPNISVAQELSGGAIVGNPTGLAKSSGGNYWITDYGFVGSAADLIGRLLEVAPDGTLIREADFPVGTIRPADVVEGDDGRVFVTDFGAAFNQGRLLEVSFPAATTDPLDLTVLEPGGTLGNPYGLIFRDGLCVMAELPQGGVSSSDACGGVQPTPSPGPTSFRARAIGEDASSGNPLSNLSNQVSVDTGL